MKYCKKSAAVSNSLYYVKYMLFDIKLFNIQYRVSFTSGHFICHFDECYQFSYD